jgi:hypothetical protein
MGTHFPEPTLAELLSDPVTRAVMQADGVNPWELEEMLRGLAHLRAQSSDDTQPPAGDLASVSSALGHVQYDNIGKRRTGA